MAGGRQVVTMSNRDREAGERTPDEQYGMNTTADETAESRDRLPDWKDVSSDPDPSDLGYEPSQWQRVPAAEETQIIFLPTDEAILDEQRFIVLDEDSLCDLIRYR